MTYFLEDAPQAPMAPRGPDRILSTWMEGVGASFSQMLRDTNANFQRTLEVKDESYASATPAAERLGIDAIYDRYKDNVVSMDFIPQKPKTVDELFTALGPNAPQMVLDMAREQAKADPNAWGDIDLSEEGIQKRVTEMRVKDNAEEQQILDLIPNGRASAQFVGGALGMIADVRQLPFLVAGGGEGSLLKMLAREAFLNAGSEAVTLPSQFETAKELDKPDPNIGEHLLTAAVGGAVIGGGIHALGRALTYYRGRSTTAPMPNMSEDYSNIIVSVAENAIAKGEDPIIAATRAIQELPFELPPPRQQVLSADFKDWFADSKVADIGGAPVKVFHGTLDTFETFDPSKGGASTGANDAVGAIFFTNNPEVASTYADPGDPYGADAALPVRALNKVTGGLYEKANEKISSVFKKSAYLEGGNVRPSYLSIKNPETFDYGGLEYDEKYFEAIIRKAKAQGKDGIIIKNVLDTATDKDIPSDIYIVFNADQVRSAFDIKNRPPLITESRLPPVDGQVPEPLPDSVIANQAENAIADAESAFAADFPEMRHKNPLAKKVQTMGGVQASRINPATGAKEMTPAAQELAAMGITTKTHPFLFRNKGMADLDNIPAADHPGLAEVLKVDSATGYFDRQDILSALAKELTSGTKTAMSGEIAARVAELRRVSDPAARPETDFVSGQQSPTGWFVKPDDYDMFPDGRQMLADSFNKYLADAWPDVKFSDAERAEMQHELQTRGGDAEYLVSRTLERDVDFIKLPKAEAEQYDWIPGFDEPPADAVSGRGGEGIGRPGQDGAAARGGAEGDSGGQVLEATAAGDQYVAPGIESVSQRQRLEARQETPMRGSARPMDDGLFDLGARQQIDMFSDPASKEARPMLDSMTADIRDEIAKGDDFKVDMGDGKGERLASSVLDDLDKGDAAAARFDLCGRGPA